MMLYFKENIQAYEIQIEAEAGFSEAIWCNLESHGSKIIVGVVYRCRGISWYIVIGDSIVRLVDDVVCRKGPPKCVRICLPGAGIQDVRNRVASVVGPGKGGAVLVHVGTNDVDKKGSEEVMGRYRELVRELKRVRVGQIVLSGILPVRGGYTRNNRRISINLRLQALCQAEGVGFLNMWEHFEQGDGLFSKDGLHLNKRGAAVLGKGFLRALGDGIGQLSLN